MPTSIGRSTTLVGAGGGSGSVGPGTPGALAKFVTGTTLGDSIVSESGAQVSIAGGLTQTGQLIINRGTLSGASSPSIDITGTWNNAATTFTSIRLNMTDTASSAGSLLMDLQVGGTTRFNFTKGGRLNITDGGSGGIGIYSSGLWGVFSVGTSMYLGNAGAGIALVTSSAPTGIKLAANHAYQFSDTNSNPTTTADLLLRRVGAGILGQYNGANAQKFEIYNTFTSSTNFERGVFDWQGTANVLRIGTEKGSGGGTARALELVADGATRITVQPSAEILFATTIRIPNANSLEWRTGATLGSRIANSSDGVLALYNFTSTDFNRLQYGGITSSFPAHKRVSATIETRLADDSGFAATQSLYDRFGSGTPEGAVTAPVGAIYHRTDGGAGTSIYVKESGTGNTGWVAK